MSNWNKGVIEEFRSTGGKVTGFETVPLLLLHHRGAKTGMERVSPLAYQKVDGGFAIFASKAGADSNPDWYHNVLANPEVSVEVGTTTHEVVAREAAGAEHTEIWETQKTRHPTFAEYERKTSRDRIPVIVLDLVSA